VRFTDLVAALAPRRILPLAVEVAGPAGPEVRVGPAPGGPGDRIPRGALLGVFAIADTRRLTQGAPGA
jgi:hypothetical protein